MHLHTVLPIFFYYLVNVENLIGSRSITTELTLMISNNFIDMWS
jgi:hypothetical protein